MATRVYVVDAVGDGVTSPLRPKYFYTAEGAATIAGAVVCIDYGLESIYLVAANVTNAEHTAIAANADVVAFPANLDATIGANLANVRAQLEAARFPGQWVVSGTTYRAIVRHLVRCIFVAQRLNGIQRARLLPPGITLDSLVSDLSSGQRQFLTGVIESFGGTATGITLGQTLRTAIKVLADQIPLPAALLDVAL